MISSIDGLFDIWSDDIETKSSISWNTLSLSYQFVMIDVWGHICIYCLQQGVCRHVTLGELK